MMRKTIVTAFASFAMAALLPATPGNAAIYSFTFSSSDVELTATAEITVNGSDEVTAISGKISGLVDQTITGVTVNPNFPNPAYSSDGSFIYNNMYYKSNTVFDTYGLLFGTRRTRAAIGTSGAFLRASIRSTSRGEVIITRSRRPEL
jgi:ABC-type phosphate transport system substrate-binding protein